MKKLSLPLALTAALAALASGCSTNTQGDSASPVFLTCDFTLRPGVWNVASNALLQFDTVTLTSKIKSPTAAGGATTFLDTQVDTYAVVWTRIDGGKTASPTETFAPGVIVPAGGTSTLTNYPFMRASSLQQPPLSYLFPYNNNGVDPETGNTQIVQSGNVTFYGHTLSGQPVTSVPASFDMIFYYSAAASRVKATRSR